MGLVTLDRLVWLLQELLLPLRGLPEEEEGGGGGTSKGFVEAGPVMVGMEGVESLSMVREGVGEEEVVEGGGLATRPLSGECARLTVSRYRASALRHATGMSCRYCLAA